MIVCRGAYGVLIIPLSLAQFVMVYYPEQALNIYPYGEEAAYLAGHISRLMFPKAKYFMCGRYGLQKYGCEKSKICRTARASIGS